MISGEFGRRPAPHWGIAARHIELLTGSASTSCHFRLLRGHGEAWNGAGTLAECWSHIEASQRNGWQAYIVVNQGGHNAASITRVRALFVDGDSIPTPTTWHAEPDFIVRRDATHWHAYWLMAEMPKADFKAAQKRLAAYYGTDPKVCDLPRVMRLAGTLHLKDPACPYLITIEADGNARHPRNARRAAELLAGLPEIAATKRRSATVPSGQPVSLEILRDMLGYLDPGCDRDAWRDIIAAIRAAPAPDDDDESGRRQLAREWSAGEYATLRPHNYDGPDDVDRVFDDMEPPEPEENDKIHFGSLVVLARNAGYGGPISIAEAAPDARFRAAAETCAEHDFWERIIEASQGAIRRMPEPTDDAASPEFVAKARAIITEERRWGEDAARRWGLK